VLELAVLGGVYQRVDTAVGKHQNHGEVIEPADDETLWKINYRLRMAGV